MSPPLYSPHCLSRPQPAAVCCPAQLLQCSQYTCNRSDQNLGAGERERWADDLNISQQSRGRSSPVLRERARHNKKASSLFLCPRNFQFSFSLPQNLASSSFLAFIAAHNTKQILLTTRRGEKRQEEGLQNFISDKTTKKVKLTVYQS